MSGIYFLQMEWMRMATAVVNTTAANDCMIASPTGLIIDVGKVDVPTPSLPYQDEAPSLPEPH